MYAEYSIVDDNGECQEVEHVCEVGPYMGRSIFTNAFGIETVRLRGVSADRTFCWKPYLCYGPRFVVPSN